MQHSQSPYMVRQCNFNPRFHVITYSVLVQPFNSIKSMELGPSGLQMGDLLLSEALRSAVHPLSKLSDRIAFTAPNRLLLWAAIAQSV